MLAIGAVLINMASALPVADFAPRLCNSSHTLIDWCTMIVHPCCALSSHVAVAASNPGYRAAENPLAAPGLMGANATLVENQHYGSASFSSTGSYAPAAAASAGHEYQSVVRARAAVLARARKSVVDVLAGMDFQAHVPQPGPVPDAVSGFDTRTPAVSAAAAAPAPQAFSNPNYEFIDQVYSTVDELK